MRPQMKRKMQNKKLAQKGPKKSIKKGKKVSFKPSKSKKVVKTKRQETVVIEEPQQIVNEEPQLIVNEEPNDDLLLPPEVPIEDLDDNPVKDKSFEEQKQHWMDRLDHDDEIGRVTAAANLADLMATEPNVDEEGAQVLKESADTFREWAEAREEITRLNHRRDQLKAYIFLEQNKRHLETWVTYIVMKKMKAVVEKHVRAYARKHQLRSVPHTCSHYTDLH